MCVGVYEGVVGASVCVIFGILLGDFCLRGEREGTTACECIFVCVCVCLRM